MRPLRPMRRVRPAAPLPNRRRYVLPGDDFVRLAMGRCLIYLRQDLIAQADAILAAVIHLPTNTAEAESIIGAGNRHSGYPLNLNGYDFFVRHARRGGLIRFLTSGLYFGLSPRPVHELAVTAEARRRGVPVAEPLGAIVQWVAPALYRGAFLTRMLHGMTLWQFVQTDDDPMVREHVVGLARGAINLAHRQGLFHADLNLHNIFVSTADETFSIILLDLDKARLYKPPLTRVLRSKNLIRLRRSLHKLDPQGRYFSEALVTALTSP
ncbi:MAG TPA: lipopolysaccharide kinase InaA family protein [Candidatus Binataceae bacterium]|nr:lipopolysaccharide kinase InaA family protein [Candidatus Binataceae bacterium]